MELADVESLYESEDLWNRVGYGDAPALVVIDLQKGLTRPEYTGGHALDAEIANTNELVDAGHDAGVPTVFTVISYEHPDGADGGTFMEKIPTLERFQAGTEHVELDDALQYDPDADYVLEKKQSSSFHDTELESMLSYWGVDTLVVTGFSTSGCVRATANDAMAHGYHVIVPEECVGDRHDIPHKANLFDINAKYGDVRPMDEVAAYLRE